MKYKVFIDGSQGTTGLKIHDRLKQRDDIELILLSDKLRKDVLSRKEAINNSDVTFLCLPDLAAIEAVTLLDKDNFKTKIIDASTAHRTDKNWAYGFPELSDFHRQKIKMNQFIAVPGCHASGFISLVYPLISEKIMPKDYPVCCHSITGFSGGGKSMINEYNNERKAEFDSPRQYALSQCHKHQKEMKEISKISETPIINPIVSDFYSGMVVSIPLFSRLLLKKLSAKDIHLFFNEYYKNSKFINVIPFGGDNYLENGFLGSNNLSNKNNMEILVAGNEERILLASRFDNLGKGSSGAAVQCFNITLGLDETLSLL